MSKWGETLEGMSLTDGGEVEAFMVVFKRKDDNKIYWGGDMGRPYVAAQLLRHVKQMVKDLQEHIKRGRDPHFETCRHRWQYSGSMPNTGAQFCIYCGTRKEE